MIGTSMTNDSTYTDALGNPIVIGKLYGYNQYSSGIFSNARFMPLQLLTVKGSEKKTVKGLMCNDGSFCYGERSGEPEVFAEIDVRFEVVRAVVRDSSEDFHEAPQLEGSVAVFSGMTSEVLVKRVLLFHSSILPLLEIFFPVRFPCLRELNQDVIVDVELEKLSAVKDDPVNLLGVILGNLFPECVADSNVFPQLGSCPLPSCISQCSLSQNFKLVYFENASVISHWRCGLLESSHCSFHKQN